MKTWSKMMTFSDYNERLEYLHIGGRVGKTRMETDRYFSEKFYRSTMWRSVRRQVIQRDRFCDLAIIGLELQQGDILIHHITPISMDDIVINSPKLYSLENLVSCSRRSHDIIHYGPLQAEYVGRKPRDHVMW